MSVSFMWEVVKPSKAKSFGAGTSSDIEALRNTFGEFITATQLPILAAMHRATGLDRSLWGEIHDTLERLAENDPEVTIKIWTQF